jgi:hypothetical protein
LKEPPPTLAQIIAGRGEADQLLMLEQSEVFNKAVRDFLGWGKWIRQVPVKPDLFEAH